jgi:polysaccharide pyruvyl transferase WcaK-like protein
MRNVLIINQYSSNKGDRAVLYALVKLLGKYKDYDITVSTSNISDWDNSFIKERIKFVPWGWDYHLATSNYFLKIKFFILRRIVNLTYALVRTVLLRNYKSIIISPFINPEFLTALKETDIVISTGGHHITTILADNAISPQVFDLACCLIYNKPVVLWAQSIGPLIFTNKTDELFIKTILHKVHSIYIRDEKSKSVLSECNVDDSKIFLTYETVLSLNNQITNYTNINQRDNIIGISIYSTVNRTPTEIDQYVNALSSFINFCIDFTGYKIVFVPMELKGSAPDDRWLINKILKKVNNIQFCSLLDQDLFTDEHFNFIQNCKYFIGHKTHSVIFSLAAGTPLIAIAYHPKTFDFMKQFGMEQFVISDNVLNSELLIETFKSLTLNAEQIGKDIFDRCRDLAETIQDDFDLMIKSNIND